MTEKTVQKSRAAYLQEFDSLPEWARVDERMVAAVLSCSVAKLQRDRVYGGDIPFVREGGRLVENKRGEKRIYGGRIYYLKQDVVAHLRRGRTIASTSDAA
jgi:hypothetical protein